uniref:thioesterase family protein n=1 Tax=Roseivirga sp. TaxID=1964215 RepID=UPI0040476383
MKNEDLLGQFKNHCYQVKAEDFAIFDAGTVHEVVSTFALAREMEWATRLFALEMREEDEEGIGTFVEIKHLAPAVQGAELIITAQLVEIRKNEIICEVLVKQVDRLVASGRTGQKILKREKLKQIFSSLER